MPPAATPARSLGVRRVRRARLVALPHRAAASAVRAANRLLDCRGCRTKKKSRQAKPNCSKICLQPLRPPLTLTDRQPRR